MPIVTGQRGEGYVELVNGPPVGSRVVAKAATMLVTGDTINPVEAPASGGGAEMTDENEFRLSAWGIRNPIPVTVLFIGLVLMGLFAYLKLPIKNFPNVQFPAVAVSVTRSGAAPAEMESQITRPVENSMAGLPNVQSIASTITQGSSTTVVQFYLGTDLQKARRRRAHAHRSGPRRTCRATSIRRWSSASRSMTSRS